MFASPFKKRFNQKMKDSTLLGEGQYGKVFLVDDKTMKRQVAVKVVSKKGLKTAEDKAFMQSELKIHSECDHPNIIKLYEYFSDKKSFYLVLELMAGGELFDRIFDKENPVKYTEKKAATVVRNITEALLYLHEKNIVHRDIKPENLLLPTKEDDTNVKLCDLGIAADCSESLNEPYGTLLYIAPEIIQQIPYKQEVDLWSLGVILFSMLCGYPPLYNPDPKELSRKIVKGRIGFIPPDWVGVSEEAKDLVLKLLERDVQKRFTAKDVLEHTWLEHAEENEISQVAERFRQFKAKALLSQAFGGLKAVHVMKDLFSLNKQQTVDGDNELSSPLDS